MKNDLDMLAAARRGFAGDVDNAALFSSAMWLAHVAGAKLGRHGVTAPTKCSMSRGFSVKLETASGMRWIVKFATDHLIPQTPERLA